MVVGKHSSEKMNAHLTVTAHAAVDCDAFLVLTAVLAAGLHCGITSLFNAALVL